MRKYYFDTSAINRLLEEPSVRRVARKAGKQFVIFPSVFTIAEVAGTTDPDQRIKLLRFLKNISGEFRPIGMPSEILGIELQSRKFRKPSMEVSMGPQWDGLWAAFNEPELLEQEDIDEVKEWTRNEEERILSVFRDNRDLIQGSIDELPESDRKEILRSYSNLMKSFIETDGFILNTVNSFAQIPMPGADLQQDQVDELLEFSDFWRLFLAALGFMFYTFSVKKSNYSTRKNRNPGSIDLQQAMFLPICDTFVSEDKRQRRALRIISRFAKRRPNIWSVTQFMKREV